jgi:C4-dicarboxylate-specific signal transduction histidine kinase
MVRDNGGGIPEAFETPTAPDFLTLRSVSDGPPSLGIGLAAARWMAAREGGTLAVERADPGTIARLRLPAV